MAQTLAETLRHAAWVIEHYGWSEGANARTTEGMVCAIKSSEAAYFSLYGAISKAFDTFQGVRGDVGIQQGEAWHWLTERAREAIPPAQRVVGQHPIMLLNDISGSTGAHMVLFLRQWAGEAEKLAETANLAKTE